MLSQHQIQEKLLSLGEHLEQATHEYADLLSKAADAEADYKAVFLRAWAQIEGSAASKEKLCNIEALEECRRWKAAQARVTAQQEFMRSLRALIDMYRTLDSDMRAQT